MCVRALNSLRWHQHRSLAAVLSGIQEVADIRELNAPIHTGQRDPFFVFIRLFAETRALNSPNRMCLIQKTTTERFNGCQLTVERRMSPAAARIAFLFSMSSGRCRHVTDITRNSLYSMSDIKSMRKQRYDGRTKKRKWEDRRSDVVNESDQKRERTEPFERIKRRKYALLMGYSGVNYFGMQRNPQMATIEEDLFKALLDANLMTQEAYNQVQLIQFQRAARTDKGVSAARQIVSLKLPESTEISKINDFLPETIRIFGIKRVTKGFNSKSQCDGRTYFYMLPTVAFANYNEEVTQEEFRLSDEKLSQVSTILNKFVGTKNFHNYTSKKKWNDPSASRYIMSFNCEKPFTSNGVEFVVLKVKGQSFMLHQIRKMVGITLAVIRGHTDEETFAKTFTKEKVNVPRAPGLGLVLDFVHYDRYNNRYGADHDKLEWTEENELVEKFKEKYIYPIIVDTEVKEKSMLEWLTNLLIHRYDIIEEEGENNDEAGESGDEDEKCEENLVGETTENGTNQENETKNVENVVNSDKINV